MELDLLIKKRKSVHSFKNKTPSWKDILDAISASLEGPFAGNQNNLKFIIVERPETIKQISSHSQQNWINESNLLIVVCSDDTHLENIYGERGRIYSRQQAGAAIQTILLKLTELGIDSCWIGAYTDELIKQLLKIPQHIQIEAIIPTGYEKLPIMKKPKKKELETIINWEEWNNKKRPPFFKEQRRDPPQYT